MFQDRWGWMPEKEMGRWWWCWAEWQVNIFQSDIFIMRLMVGDNERQWRTMMMVLKNRPPPPISSNYLHLDAHVCARHIGLTIEQQKSSKHRPLGFILLKGKKRRTPGKKGKIPKCGKQIKILPPFFPLISQKDKVVMNNRGHTQ